MRRGVLARGRGGREAAPIPPPRQREALTGKKLSAAHAARREGVGSALRLPNKCCLQQGQAARSAAPSRAAPHATRPRPPAFYPLLYPLLAARRPEKAKLFQGRLKKRGTTRLRFAPRRVRQNRRG